MIHRFVCLILLITAYSCSLYAQSDPGRLYSLNKVGFIENRDRSGVQSTHAPYRTEINGLRVYFANEGFRYSVEGNLRKRKQNADSTMLDGPDTHEIIKLKEELSVLFVNPSDSITLEALDLRKNYVIQHHNVRQLCYGRILYRNVWPHIDIEFTLPEKGGLKYNVYLSPGADVDNIQLDYSDANNTRLIEGNLYVQSAVGKWIEYAPVSFTEAGNPLASGYKLENGILSFDLDIDEILAPLVIDPWIALIPAINSYDDLSDPVDSLWTYIFFDLAGTGLDNAYNRVQLDYDASGNIYLSQIACLYYESNGFVNDFFSVGRYVHKFDSQGNLLFTVDQGYEETMTTDISVNKATQEIYSVRLFSDLLYMSPDGIITDSFTIDDLPEEIDEINSLQYDHCQDKLLLGLGADLNEVGTFIATTGASFTGALDYSFAYDFSLSFPDFLPYNDNIDVLIDPYSGDYFYLFLLRTLGFLESRAVLRTDPVNVNPIWQTNGDFLILTELAMHSVGVVQSNFGRNHYEALVCGRSSVYGMNGAELVQWDKADGSQQNEVGLVPQLRGRAEGIDIDICGNLYVGGDNEILVFDSLLNPLLTIPLAGMPQDIHVFGKTIYVAEDFNIESIDIPQAISPWQLTQEPDSCGLCVGGGSIAFCGNADAPGGITVEWPNGTFGLSTTGLCAGWNQVKIYEEKGCYTNVYLDSLFVESSSEAFCAPAVSLNDLNICEGDCITLTAQVSGQAVEPFTFTWSNGISGEAAEIEVCPGTTTIYFVTVQDTNGEVLSDSALVTVAPVPVVNLGGDIALCEAVEIQLDAGNNGAQFLWQDGTQSQVYTVSESGVYWVDVTIDECTRSDTVAVQFGSLLLDLGNDTTVCDLSGFILDAGEGPFEYLWQDGSTGQLFSPTQAGTYFVTITEGDCSIADAITISVSEIEASFEITQPIECDVAPAAFSNLSVGADAWSWAFGDGAFSTDENPVHIYQAAGQYTVLLTVLNAFGCEDTFTETVAIQTLPAPVALFSVSPAFPVTFSEIQFTDESIDALVWNWNLGDGTTSTSQNVGHSYEFPGLYPVELVVENEFCSDAFKVFLTVREELIIYVPSSFTPNEDGINDLFGPVITGSDIAEFEMLIFNRWGNLLFKSNNIDQRWNGSHQGSASQDAASYYVENGVYVWHITVKENFTVERQELFGTVTLIR